MYDVNIYLRVAEQLGPDPWEDLEGSPPPVRGSSEQQALSIAIEAVLAEPLRLELWTSQHITELILAKLLDPVEYDGLSWDERHAIPFAQRALDIAYDSGGDEIVVRRPQLAPPLDHEDGLVLATAKEVRATYLVTNDTGFRAATGSEWQGINVMTARQWVKWVDSWRRTARNSRR